MISDMEIFNWLDNTSLVVAYTVRDFRTSASAFYLNLHLQLIDQSELYARDFRSAGWGNEVVADMVSN